MSCRAPRTTAHRPPALIAVTPALATLVLGAAGCGDDGGAGSEPPSTPGGKGSALELTLDADGPGGEPSQAEAIECPDPPNPDDDPACAEVLLLSPDDLEPVPPNVACTEIYGGPDTLEVTGTLEGERAEGTFTRENGCEISRFDAWVPLARQLFPDYKPGAALASQ